MSHMRFQKLPRSLLAITRSHQLLERVADAVSRQVEGPRGPDPERLVALPISARTIYWLWHFQCEAGICGMDVFVLNHVGINSPEIHTALRELGANELARLVEEAVALARDGPAEFKRLSDQSWFEQFAPSGEFAGLDALNGSTFRLTEALTDLAENYIRSHEAELFEHELPAPDHPRR